MIKCASVDVAVRLELDGQTADLAVYASGEFAGARVALEKDGQTLWERTLDLSPVSMLTELVPDAGGDPTALTLRVSDAQGRLLVSYTPEPERIEKTPEPAKAAPDPADAPRDLSAGGLLSRRAAARPDRRAHQQRLWPADDAARPL